MTIDKKYHTSAIILMIVACFTLCFCAVQMKGCSEGNSYQTGFTAGKNAMLEMKEKEDE